MKIEVCDITPNIHIDAGKSQVTFRAVIPDPYLSRSGG